MSTSVSVTGQCSILCILGDGLSKSKAVGTEEMYILTSVMNQQSVLTDEPFVKAHTRTHFIHG